MLNIQNLKKSYTQSDGSQLAILDIEQFQIQPAEQMVLMGRSGCGKTTLLHVVAGISRPDQGTVTINGLDITRLSEPGCDRFRAENIGYVFQTFNLLPGFTALENVALGMSFAAGKYDKQRAAKLLDRVGLSSRASHKPTAMSVGEQQRVAVARALANRPKLLLADEPTANVDPDSQQIVVDLIRQTCREEEISLLIVTHTPEVANQFERVDRLEDVNRVLKSSAQNA